MIINKVIHQNPFQEKTLFKFYLISEALLNSRKKLSYSKSTVIMKEKNYLFYKNLFS